MSYIPGWPDWFIRFDALVKGHEYFGNCIRDFLGAKKVNIIY